MYNIIEINKKKWYINEKEKTNLKMGPNEGKPKPLFTKLL